MNIVTQQGYQGTQVALLDSPAPSQKEGTPAKTDGGDGEFQAFGSDGFTFADFIDIINPLQHIPLVSTLYRNVTGDTIDPGSEIAGGTLFGGPIGAVVSIVNVAVEETTGMGMGEHVVALLSDPQPEAIDTKFARDNPLANFETASGMAKKDTYTAPSGAEMALLDSERMQAFASTDPGITRAEIELIKAEAQGAANITEVTAEETEAETAILKAEARPVPPLARLSLSPVIDQTGVLDWARKEARIAAEKRTVPNNPSDNAPTGAIAELGGWFTDVNSYATASYRHGAALASPVKSPKMNFLR